MNNPLEKNFKLLLQKYRSLEEKYENLNKSYVDNIIEYNTLLEDYVKFQNSTKEILKIQKEKYNLLVLDYNSIIEAYNLYEEKMIEEEEK